MKLVCGCIPVRVGPVYGVVRAIEIVTLVEARHADEQLVLVVQSEHGRRVWSPGLLVSHIAKAISGHDSKIVEGARGGLPTWAACILAAQAAPRGVEVLVLEKEPCCFVVVLERVQ